MANKMLTENIIRVFPRRTRWTPKDDLAFVGDPQLFMPPEMPVHISVTFTWDIPEAERLYRAWSVYYKDVQLGGPAFDDPGQEFIPNKYLSNGATITSRGCPKQCNWCLAWRRERNIRELPIMPGHDVVDNNLLACSKKHIEAVFDMLKQQEQPIKFSGGLDVEMLQEWHIDLLKSIRLQYAWFACDYPGAIYNLERAADLLSDIGRNKKRCYVLIGFDGESTKNAEKRLEQVFNLGFLPFAMLYRPPEMKQPRFSVEWKDLQRKWCRPAIYKSIMKKVNQ